MTRLTYLPAAREDLAAITSYIADDDPDRAETFVAELRARAGEAAERPRTFPARDDLAPGLRVASHGRYMIFFMEKDDGVQIVRVLHGARNLKRIFEA